MNLAPLSSAIGMMACPPRPETGTGSGGAKACEYAMAFSAYEWLTFHYRTLACQPALARCDVNIQLLSVLVNAWPSMSAFWRARSGPGVKRL